MGAYGTAITVDQGGSLWLGVAVGLALAAILALLLVYRRCDYAPITSPSSPLPAPKFSAWWCDPQPSTR